MKKLILACSLAAASLPAFAKDLCATSPVSAPAVPQAVASADELISLHAEVSDYIAEAEKRLVCESDVSSYNALVDNMHLTAGQFNRLLTEYKASYKSASL